MRVFESRFYERNRANRMNKKRREKFLVAFVLVVILSGCSASDRFRPETVTPAVHQENEATMLAISTPPPASTHLPILQTVPICQGDGKHILATSKLGISGTIIYQIDRSSSLYALGGTPLSASQLLIDEARENFIFGFSLDGKWLAYSPFQANRDAKFEQMDLILISADGEKIEQILSVKDFEHDLQVGHQLVGVSGLSYWINANLIYVSLYSQNPDPNTSRYISDLPKVLNPFSGQWNNQLLDLPGRFLSGVVGISPDLTRALYVEKGLSLWDYDGKVRIWHDETRTTLFRPLIFWSSNSAMAAYADWGDIADNQPILLISRDGKSSSIMDKKFPLSDLRVHNISWSPNGQYLAIAGADGENLTILVYDVQSQKYITQCRVAKLSSTLPPLIWSPDSSKIATSDYDSPILIFDIFSGTVFELVQRGRVYGWSDRFPANLETP